MGGGLFQRNITKLVHPQLPKRKQVCENVWMTDCEKRFRLDVHVGPIARTCGICTYFQQILRLKNYRLKNLHCSTRLADLLWDIGHLVFWATGDRTILCRGSISLKMKCKEPKIDKERQLEHLAVVGIQAEMDSFNFVACRASDLTCYQHRPSEHYLIRTGYFRQMHGWKAVSAVTS